MNTGWIVIEHAFRGQWNNKFNKKAASRTGGCLVLSTLLLFLFEFFLLLQGVLGLLLLFLVPLVAIALVCHWSSPFYDEVRLIMAWKIFRCEL
jgi:hypothetical protein